MNDEKNTRTAERPAAPELPLISVVIPVYKTEAYLARCVESVRGQTYQNLEILLVDDGSPDNCPALCDGYAAQDARVRVLHKPNGGLSDARNAGTLAAQGEYITYVDSDDWIEASMIARLYNALAAQGAEIAVCGYQSTTGSGALPQPDAQPAEYLSGPQAMEQMLYQQKIENSAWGKLYPLTAARRHLYPVGRLYEDLFTTYRLLYEARRVAVLPQKLYYYFTNEASIMHQSFTPRMFDALDAADEIEAFVQQQCPQYLPAARARKFSAYSQVLRWMPTEKQPQKSEQSEQIEIEQKRRAIWAFLTAYRWQMARDKNARAKNRAAALATLLGQTIFVKL
jgi:glycosyltransferase involved in cell wall biosynthesis